jgi:hypothetical protein
VLDRAGRVLALHLVQTLFKHISGVALSSYRLAGGEIGASWRGWRALRLEALARVVGIAEKVGVPLEY